WSRRKSVTTRPESPTPEVLATTRVRRLVARAGAAPSALGEPSPFPRPPPLCPLRERPHAPGRGGRALPLNLSSRFPGPPPARPAGALPLGADDHRPQLHELEFTPVLSDPSLPVKHRSAAVELDCDRGRRQERARQRQTERRAHDVQRPVHRVPSIRSQRSGG